MKNIFIYGIGRTANRYFKNLDKNQYTVIGFLDSYKKDNMFLNKPVYYIDEVLNKDWDEIHVASVYLEIVILLLQKKIEKTKIVLCDYDLFLEYANYNHGISDLRFRFPCVLTRPMLYRNAFNSSCIEFYNNEVIGSFDYCRYNTLALLAEEIERNSVIGEIAELGVFRGEFAKLLNKLFPDRNLYLFDTFEGFVPEEQEYEITHLYTNKGSFIGNRDFKNTSVEIVLKKMENKKKCIVKKGKFPETIPQSEQRFALVSIDCDLYVPVLEGLKYFYPRLNEGGYIMLHDYNSDDFTGIKKAVSECEKIYGKMHKVPIPDRDGTLVISK